MPTDSTTRLPTLRTLDSEITLDSALEEEHDMLQRLVYWGNGYNFLVCLLVRNTEVEMKNILLIYLYNNLLTTTSIHQRQILYGDSTSYETAS